MARTDTDLGALRMVAADLVHAGCNDRKAFDQAALEALATSIERDGLAQPPTVRPCSDGSFEIVAGERRCRAMGLLGWAEYPVFVREMSDGAASATMLVENLVREDLDPVAEAGAYRARMDQGLSVADVAGLVGKSQRTIRARVDLLELGSAALDMVSAGTMPLGHAAQLVGLDGDRQALAIRALAASDLSAPAFTAICDRLRREQEAAPMFDADAFWSVEEYVVAGQAAAARKVSGMCGQILSTRQVAEILDLQPASINKLVKRGTFPQPDGRLEATPWWHAETIEAWQQTRRPKGRPRKDS